MACAIAPVTLQSQLLDAFRHGGRKRPASQCSGQNNAISPKMTVSCTAYSAFQMKLFLFRSLGEKSVSGDHCRNGCHSAHTGRKRCESFLVRPFLNRLGPDLDAEGEQGPGFQPKSRGLLYYKELAKFFLPAMLVSHNIS